MLERITAWLNRGDNSMLACITFCAPLLAITFIGLFGGGA